LSKQNLSIAIVILNWNGKDLLRKFLPDIIRYSDPVYTTIYLADNASTDDSIDFVKHNFSEVKIIKNDKNYGYAQGYNEALKQVDADIFGLVNSDIEATKDWLIPILEHFQNKTNTAVVQPKILDYKNKQKFEYAGAGGGLLDRLGYPYCRGRVFNTLETDKGQYDDTQKITWASGACFFVRGNVFKELQGFDDLYFAHQEEVDLCWRAQNRGYDVQYVGATTVYHVGGATLHNSHWQKTFLNFRNSLFNLVKNAPHYPILVFFRLLLDGVAGLKFLFEGKFIHTWAIILAHFSFYRNFGKMLKKRRKTTPKKSDYYSRNSIVWDYFIRGKRTYHQ
jgi:GT2 family glycosyltransferase